MASALKTMRKPAEVMAWLNETMEPLIHDYISDHSAINPWVGQCSCGCLIVVIEEDGKLYPERFMPTPNYGDHIVCECHKLQKAYING